MRRILRKLFPPAETLDGYDHAELVDVIFRKTLAYQPTDAWPEMQGAGSVLDFGGGCGLHYKQAQSPTIQWAVVETPAMVARARDLETDHLKFFTEIAAAADWLGHVEVMHSNGALQYAENPAHTLAQLCAIDADRMFWYRVLLGPPESQIQKSRLSDNGPGPIKIIEKNVRYRRTAIPESDFLAAHHRYRLAARGPDWFRFGK